MSDVEERYDDEVDYEEEDIMDDEDLIEELDADDGMDGDIVDAGTYSPFRRFAGRSQMQAALKNFPTLAHSLTHVLHHTPDEIEADDIAPAEGAGGAAGDKGQMLYIPGIGYIPLSSLGGLGQNLNLGAARQAQAPPNPEGEKEWTGFGEMPSITQDSISDLFGALQEDEKSELTVLVLGKGGAGKSSTVNSLFNEQVAQVQAFGLDSTRPITYSRVAPSGFVFHIIDTPSLLDQDVVAEGRLEAVAKAIKDKEIDAVIFLDRLDEYAVGSVDKALIKAVTRFFGPSIWDNTVLCFSRGAETSAPPGIDFYEHVSQREAQVKRAIAAAGGKSSDMASALVENSSRCPRNNDDEKIVSGDTPWVTDVLEKIVEVALNHLPYEYNEEAAKKTSNPNSRRKWLIPLVLAAQIGAKFLLDKLLDDDGCRGDENGPFDAQTIEERRAELREERKESTKSRKSKKLSARFEDDDDASEEEVTPRDGDNDDDDDLMDSDVDE
jgi:GTPase Era involved in 16S rRNA processing